MVYGTFRRRVPKHVPYYQYLKLYLKKYEYELPVVAAAVVVVVVVVSHYSITGLFLFPRPFQNIPYLIPVTTKSKSIVINLITYLHFITSLVYSQGQADVMYCNSSNASNLVLCALLLPNLMIKEHLLVIHLDSRSLYQHRLEFFPSRKIFLPQSSTDNYTSSLPSTCINPKGWHHATENLSLPTLFCI
jgi:hypothetical protein